MKTHYLIYQITNILNGMIYIGQHRTTNIDDGYMGSGTLLKEEQRKLGIWNFKKTILFECSSQDELNKKERELVNEEFIARSDTYNQALGGGYELTHEQATVVGKLGAKVLYERLQNDIEFKQSVSRKISASLVKRWKNNPEGFAKFHCDWTGRHHSDTAKQKMRENCNVKYGLDNPASERIWMYNDIVKKSAFVQKNLMDDYLSQGWVVGRIVKWDKPKKVNISQKKVYHIDQKQIEYYKMLLPIYLKYKWSEFVKRTGYQRTNQNFHYQIKMYLNLDRASLKIMKKKERL